uniref:Uncharacterized protein n=1 Tax=Candidatus Kentrum sp. UNK TaxID=2126344 RepID=A0A451B108_9GAMM|nr:MAG: hypothetical protein BECKUNK1418G_GA0071005_10883 [Candidatus Kentron sp. UNK]VFK71968.1 MAG: hypothetical protein BECKUNK1418H_GA0071006_10893 [Candidatus Kentron sp. UNK]
MALDPREMSIARRPLAIAYCLLAVATRPMSVDSYLLAIAA